MSGNNLVEVFEASVNKNKENVCFRYVENGKWQSLNWLEVRSRVQEIAGGLRKLGLEKGDRVCIFSKTRFEWTLADIATLAAQGIVVPIYESNTATQAQYIVENSEAKVIFVENVAQYKKIKSVADKLPKLEQVILFDDDSSIKGEEGVYSLEEVMLMGNGEGKNIYATSIQVLMGSDEATYVYTSGTTGNPKGAVLTHENILAEVEAGMKVFNFKPHYESLIFLPLAHILARVVQFFQIYAGFIQCYAESIDKLLDNISEVRPHFMASVPRIFEKIHTRTLQGVEAGSPLKQKIYHWAYETGCERSQKILNRKPVPIGLKFKSKIAKKLVFQKLHDKLGGRIEFFISGGAPLSPEIASFFHAFGFSILEGYGLTETTAAISINSEEAIKIGSVGKPIDCVKIKIAPDGEILAKGKVIFKGYFKNPKATEESMDDEGWFHTGDIGEFDENGFLTITDRKKDIIVTAAGKNIAPQNIENFMIDDPYISQVMIHGDKRKYLSALVTLDQEQIQTFAKSENIPFSSYDELVSNRKVYDFIRNRIESKNKNLAQYETIKKFAILAQDFSIEGGELTPTLKVKRKVISGRYENLLNSFYCE